jgi:hypothetical protein
MMDEGPDFEERVSILFRKMDINQNGAQRRRPAVHGLALAARRKTGL